MGLPLHCEAGPGASRILAFGPLFSLSAEAGTTRLQRKNNVICKDFYDGYG
jgi:hypothetical protein